MNNLLWLVLGFVLGCGCGYASYAARMRLLYLAIRKPYRMYSRRFPVRLSRRSSKIFHRLRGRSGLVKLADNKNALEDLIFESGSRF